jgi:hypothetical protein
MNKKNNSKIELVDFNGILKRVKIKQRKSGMYKKRKPRSKNV